MELKDKVTLIISTLAFTLSAANFAYSRFQESKASRDSLVKALQGEKEAVAYVAYKVRSEKWHQKFKRKDDFRKDVITALCLAWSLESSDRTKSLIFDALSKMASLGYKNDVSATLLDIQEQFTNYNDQFKPTNFKERLNTVKKLMDQLDIKTGATP